MKMKRFKWQIAFSLIILLVSCISSREGASRGAHGLSPFSFGLSEARNGVERYQVLLKTHLAAVKAGVNVDYSGIKRVEIEIPDKSTQIPLTRHNDFKGCVFVVKNTRKSSLLFTYAKKATPINVSKQSLDAGFFNFIEHLNRGRYLLLIEDENPWVQNRRGHDYGHQRKDVLLVENGRAKNTVTMPYNNADSKPKCSYIPQDNTPFVFKNITIERDPGCKFVTNVASISGVDNVQILNVKVHTPANTLMNDRGIRISNCTNVTLDNVRIDGTYSQPDHSGYGFTLNNIWNLKVSRMYGKANWGVFGNNNINVATIEDSQINRFDIHCYGRDISFKNMEFFTLYNQYASVFGTIRYDKCTFTNFVPVLNGGSYNAYVAHDIVMNDCVFNATEKKNYLIKMSGMGVEVNERNELAKKALPNVRIKNLTVNLTGGADYLYVFNTNSDGKKVNGLDYISDIAIDGLVVVPDKGSLFRGMALSNVQLNTAKSVECTVQNMEVKQTAVKKQSAATSTKTAVLKANIPLKSGKAVLKNVAGLKQ